MKDPDQPVLFDLKARQLDYRLSASMLHFNDGMNAIQFSRTTINPFQVITWHVGEIPAAWMVDHGKYPCFRAALTIAASSSVVREELAKRSGSARGAGRPADLKVDQPSPFLSWWAE